MIIERSNGLKIMGKITQIIGPVIDVEFENEQVPSLYSALKIESKVHRKLVKYHAGLSGFDGATEWFNTTPKVAKGAILKALSGTEVLGHSEADSLQLALI